MSSENLRREFLKYAGAGLAGTGLALQAGQGIARAAADAFNVVVTDLKLPGLNGLDLVRQLHAARPRLPDSKTRPLPIPRGEKQPFYPRLRPPGRRPSPCLS